MQNLILSYFKPPLARTMDVLVTKLTVLISNCRKKKGNSKNHSFKKVDFWIWHENITFYQYLEWPHEQCFLP